MLDTEVASSVMWDLSGTFLLDETPASFLSLQTDSMLALTTCSEAMQGFYYSPPPLILYDWGIFGSKSLTLVSMSVPFVFTSESHARARLEE